jgi:hypothetical protein
MHFLSAVIIQTGTGTARAVRSSAAASRIAHATAEGMPVVQTHPPSAGPATTQDSHPEECSQ